MKKVQQQTKQQEPLLLRELEQAHKCGDAFVTAQRLYEHCRFEDPALTLPEFEREKQRLIQEGSLCQEDTRLYLPHVCDWKNKTAAALARVLRANRLPAPRIPETLKAGTSPSPTSSSMRWRPSWAMDSPSSRVGPAAARPGWLPRSRGS